MKPLLFIVVSFSAAGLCGCCNDYYSCLNPSFLFRQEVAYFPREKAIQVGDTLWLFTQFPCANMINLYGNVEEDYCNASEMNGWINIYKLEADSNGAMKGAADDFNFVEKRGFVNVPEGEERTESRRNFSFFLGEGFFGLQVGFVPKNTGRYGFIINGAKAIPDKKRVCCKDEAFFIFSIANPDPHLELYLEYLGVDSLNSPLQPPGYFFEVEQ